MIIRDNSGLIEALRYMTAPINLVTSSVITILIFVQSVKFCPTTSILHTNFPLPRYSTEPLLWKWESPYIQPLCVFIHNIMPQLPKLLPWPYTFQYRIMTSFSKVFFEFKWFVSRLSVGNCRVSWIIAKMEIPAVNKQSDRNCFT